MKSLFPFFHFRGNKISSYANSREDPNKKNDKPTLDETVQKLIGKAGNHMESTLVGKTGSGPGQTRLKLLTFQLLMSGW